MSVNFPEKDEVMWKTLTHLAMVHGALSQDNVWSAWILDMDTRKLTVDQSPLTTYSRTSSISITSILKIVEGSRSSWELRGSTMFCPLLTTYCNKKALSLTINTRKTVEILNIVLTLQSRQFWRSGRRLTTQWVSHMRLLISIRSLVEFRRWVCCLLHVLSLRSPLSVLKLCIEYVRQLKRNIRKFCYQPV